MGGFGLALIAFGLVDGSLCLLVAVVGLGCWFCVFCTLGLFDVGVWIEFRLVVGLCIGLFGWTASGLVWC